MKIRRKKTEQPVRPSAVRFAPDPQQGLSAEQAALHAKQGYRNTPVEPPVQTTAQIIIANVCTYFNLIFFIIAFALALVGAWVHMTFLIVIIANTAIGIIQEIRSKKVLDQLNLLNAPRAVAVRDGEPLSLPTEELVLDDIVVFSAGNQICADAVVRSGEIQVNEALITGESVEITKRSGDELLSGSFVVAGECRAQLERVGADSFVSRLTLESKKSRRRVQGAMMKSLTRLVQVIGILILPIGFFMINNEHFVLQHSWKDTVVGTAAALIGMIPEGLYLLTSVALAVSVMRLAKKQTLVHELNCIETLARVDVLCVDKTGTITENKMDVTAVAVLHPEWDEESLSSVLSDFTAAMSGDNQTMKAVRARFSAEHSRTALKVLPFSSSVKYSAAAFSAAECYVLGAPEFILKERFAEVEPAVRSFSEKGCRVLLLAQCDDFAEDGSLCGTPVPLGLVALSNRVRPQAKETFSYFTQQGVTIKVISGDSPITASQAALEAGIPNAERYIDASLLDTPEKLRDGAERYTVFGRVTPEQKRKLVDALKAAGKTVAMTGDGVNDVLALKAADCSVAMASGSEVACQVSQIVLLDSDFSAMPSVVAEGRRVINNIERSASLFLVKNIFSFLLALVSVFVAFRYPIQPVQMSLISALTIGAPSFFLALEPNSSLVRGKFLRNVLYRAVPAGLTDVFVVLGAEAFAFAFAIPAAELSTICMYLMALVGFLMLFRVSRPFNLNRGLLYGGLVTVFVFSVALLGDLLQLAELSLGGWLVFLVFALLAVPVISYFTKALDWVTGRCRNAQERLKNMWLRHVHNGEHKNP
ncbi:MAG: HAD-IC family P-type ATPase [Firmicutes bacterium]|nr:HAD-IC family P-type ATPase [Bacillota bacterium]